MSASTASAVTPVSSLRGIDVGFTLALYTDAITHVTGNLAVLVGDVQFSAPLNWYTTVEFRRQELPTFHTSETSPLLNCQATYKLDSLAARRCMKDHGCSLQDCSAIQALVMAQFAPHALVDVSAGTWGCISYLAETY